MAAIARLVFQKFGARGVTSLLRLGSNSGSSHVNHLRIVCAGVAPNREVSNRPAQYSSGPVVGPHFSQLLRLAAFPQLPSTVRTVTKYSLSKGKRKSVRAVTKRFFRLRWGIWIRTYAGRHKKLWKKSTNRKRRLRQHVFVNATQSTLLDKMVSNYWKRPHYYVDDPYEPYHEREEFWITRKKPVDKS